MAVDFLLLQGLEEAFASGICHGAFCTPFSVTGLHNSVDIIDQVKALALFAVSLTAFASEWIDVAALEPGSGVKVKSLNSRQLSGRLSRATSQAICVVRKNVETCIEKADVLSVRVKAGKARARNAAIAGGVTAAIWTTFVVLAWKGTSDSDAIPGLLGYGIPFWGGAAAGVAALFPGYTTVYKVQ